MIDYLTTENGKLVNDSIKQLENIHVIIFMKQQQKQIVHTIGNNQLSGHIKPITKKKLVMK